MSDIERNPPVTATQDEIDDIKHALGLVGGRVRAYRNHYCAEPNDEQMNRMVAKGLMRPGHAFSGGLMNFHVTEIGARCAGVRLPQSK